MEKEEDSPKDGSLQDLKRLFSIGNLTARALLEEGFSSISELEEAELEDLRSIEYIGDNLAEKILEELKNEDLADKGEVKDKLELRCPICQNFTKVEEDKCRECEEAIESTSRVVVPDQGLIENPLETLASIEEEILFDGEDAESWFTRGSILESMGANRQALESYDRVIELDPLFDHIWNAKANVSLKVGETSEAANAYKLAFDAHKGPNNIMSNIEEKKTVPSEEGKDLKEIDEKDKELDENISKARELFNEIKGREEQSSELVMTLDRVTEERTRGNKDKALELVKNLINRSEALLEIDEQMPELKNKIEKIESEGLKTRAEEDLKEVQQSIEKDDYLEAKRMVANLFHALKFEKKKLEKQVASEEKLSKIIEKIDGLSEDLTDGTDDILGLSESVSRAREFKEDGYIEKSFKAVKDYLGNESNIRNISENIDKIETMKMSLEELGFEDDFIADIEERFEEGKELCEEGDYERAEELYEELLDDIETNIEESVEDVEEELEIKIQEIERIIDNGEERGIDIEDLKNDYKKLKERLESEEGDKRDLLEEIEQIVVKGENTLAFRSNISKIEEKISEGGDEVKDAGYGKRKKELEEIFEEGDFERAIETSSELKDEIENKIEGIQKKKELKSKVESKLAKARNRLSKLRKTDFDLTRMKALLKKSNQARKKDKMERSLELAKNFIESADQMMELSEPVEKAESLVEQLAEKDLIEKDKIDYEIEQYKKLADLEKYEMSENYLLDLTEELEEALEKENKIPPPGDEFDKSSTQIPTQIKEKVRNVKELNNLVEKADIEIEVNREPLKEAIIKIKDLEYEEANEILNEWKVKLIKRLNHKLGDRVDDMSEEIKDIECPASVKKRGDTIFRDIRKKWDRAEHEEALKGLISATEFMERMSEKDKDQDKEIFLMKNTLEDIEELGYADEEMEELLDRAKENKEDEEDFKTIIEELKDKIKEELKTALDEESKNLENRVEGLNKREVVIALSNIMDLRSDLKEGNLGGAAWVGKEYIKIVGKS